MSGKRLDERVGVAHLVTREPAHPPERRARLRHPAVEQIRIRVRVEGVNGHRRLVRAHPEQLGTARAGAQQAHRRSPSWPSAGTGRSRDQSVTTAAVSASAQAPVTGRPENVRPPRSDIPQTVSSTFVARRSSIAL
ncbi:hypothetical protein GCM10009746_20300 [Microbacterium paludicola]